MKKNIKTKKTKPDEIIELEKMLNIKLKESSIDKESNILFDTSYALDLNGNVVALCLSELELVDLSPINIFKHLKYIDLTKNSVVDISDLSKHSSLEIIYLGGNKIKDISPLVSMEQLELLTLWDNPIADKQPLGKLINLKQLYCQNIGLENLHFIKELKKLTILSINSNFISDIDFLHNFKKLKTIDISNNKIKEISLKCAEKYNWLKDSITHRGGYKIQGLFLHRNPLQFPPVSVIELGPITVEDYYKTSEKYGHEPLSEGRIIFIGDGSSGKSSIIEKTLYNTFTKGRSQTNGIHIEHFQLNHPEDNRTLNFHIWDFGGQEIQHAVHKFFFTEGCLYTLVLDNRKEEDPEYWLQQIESLGGKAPVLVVFNKQDENAAETVDRKYLKEKYPNIIGFYKTSCCTGYGIAEFKQALEQQVIKLRTVDEQFPKNWLAIKKSIEELTSGAQHYLTYETYKQLCIKNQTENEAAQKLLLKYFNTIGAVTWFGDINLTMMHVLNPKWITQGVYKIITSQKTARLFGRINVSDFKELLQPVEKDDYTYDESHYAYILNMMTKFELCDSPDDINLLIPSAFGKEPKIEYKDFKGNDVTTYVLQFKDYLPLALIHRYITKNISQALDNNYWYTGIVVKDSKSKVLAMVHIDKVDKRIYVRIKGENKLGLWEHIRREFAIIASSYAKIKYNELVAIDEKESRESYVIYDDLVSYLQAGKKTYFHPKLKKDFNVGYLMGFFETKEDTIEKIKQGEIQLREHRKEIKSEVPSFVINILNENSPKINTNINTQLNIDIDIQIVNDFSSKLQGDASYILDDLTDSNQELNDALKKVIQFAEDAKNAKNSNEVISKGWGRKLKNIVSTISDGGKHVKNINDGGAVLSNILSGIKDLAYQFNFNDIIQIIEAIPPSI